MSSELIIGFVVIVCVFLFMYISFLARRKSKYIDTMEENDSEIEMMDEQRKEQLLEKSKRLLSAESNVSADDLVCANEFLNLVSKSFTQRQRDYYTTRIKELQQTGKYSEDIINDLFDTDVPSILTPLSAISIAEGFFIESFGPENKGIGGRSYLVVCTTNNTNPEQGDKNIFKYLYIEKSRKGAWQAFLLYTAWHNMPLYWHGLYDAWLRIYSKKDWNEKKNALIKEAKVADDKYLNWKKLEKIDFNNIQDDFVPKVFLEGNDAFVCCFVWNEFYGITKYVYHIDFSGGYVKCNELSQELIVECGNGMFL